MAFYGILEQLTKSLDKVEKRLAPTITSPTGAKTKVIPFFAATPYTRDFEQIYNKILHPGSYQALIDFMDGFTKNAAVKAASMIAAILMGAGLGDGYVNTILWLGGKFLTDAIPAAVASAGGVVTPTAGIAALAGGAGGTLPLGSAVLAALGFGLKVNAPAIGAAGKAVASGTLGAGKVVSVKMYDGTTAVLKALGNGALTLLGGVLGGLFITTPQTITVAEAASAADPPAAAPATVVPPPATVVPPPAATVVPGLRSNPAGPPGNPLIARRGVGTPVWNTPMGAQPGYVATADTVRSVPGERV